MHIKTPSPLLSDVSPERHQWINARCGVDTARITKLPNPDAERAWALMWARKFIKREGLLTDDRIEQKYCSLVYRYVETHGFDAKALNATESRLARVLAASRKLTGRTG